MGPGVIRINVTRFSESAEVAKSRSKIEIVWSGVDFYYF